MIDSSTDNAVNPIDFFRVKSEEVCSSSSKNNLRRAVDALCKFVGGLEIDFDSFTESMLGEWVTRLLFDGYTPMTISNNILKRLATLYNKAVNAGLAKPTDAFRVFQNKLNCEVAECIGKAMDQKVFSKLQNIISADYSADSKRQLAKDILLFAVYFGGMKFEDIANFKKNDYSGDSNAITEIIDRYSKAKNKYLFPLNQIYSTPKQRVRTLEFLLADLLESNDLKLSPNSSDTTFDLWAMTAMSCGVSASDIAACLLSRNHTNALIAFAKPSAIDDQQITDIRNQIELTLNYNPVRWYAMHLRPHIDYAMLTARLKEMDIRLEDIYYPMEEIVNKVGHKKVFETRPVISWLVFFRERVTRLNSLYSKIGDLAWGYRYINDVNSPYAVISNEEIMEYQCALGALAPDTAILSDEAVKLNKGDHLIILGGAMNGLHAVFVSEKHISNSKTGNKIVYRLKLSGGNYANWIVDQDPRLVRKISEAQFREFDRKRIVEKQNV